MTIKEIEKEIALIKELLELRGKLGGNTEVVTTVNATITGGLIPKTKPAVFGGTGWVDFDYYDKAALAVTRKIMENAAKEDKGWPSSEEAWKDVEKPFYNENTGVRFACTCGSRK